MEEPDGLRSSEEGGGEFSGMIPRQKELVSGFALEEFLLHH